MPTRRQTLVGLLALGFGSAAASASAFTSSTEPTSDLRVVVESELRLVPARDPEDTPDQAGDDDPYRYVDTDDDGEIVAFDFQHLNKRAITDFGELAEVVNDGDLTFDRLEMEFVAGEDADEAAVSAADALKIVVPGEQDEELPGNDGAYTLLGDGDENALEPGTGVTFGIGVDLLPESDPGNIEDLPDGGTDVTLHIDAIRE